jgi:ADP-ribose pyrophosphatase
MNWKTLASEYLFKETWFTIRKDTCERPDGKLITPYYVYEFPTWVTAVAITSEGKFVFEKQYRHGLELTMFEIPGGCVDPGDTSLEDAIARELKEETGYVFKEYKYLGKTSANPSTHNNWMHFFLATGGEKTARPELDDFEDIEVHLLSLAEVKRMLKDNDIVQSMHSTALFYALANMGELTF